MKIDDLINEYADCLEWLDASIKVDVIQVNKKLFDHCQYFWDWKNISQFQSLSQSFIRKYKNLVNFKFICKYQILSDSFIRECQNFINWFLISKYQTLSEVLIEEFDKHLFWSEISRNQNISEEFVEKNKDKVDWFSIYHSQDFSKEFYKRNTEYKKEINEDISNDIITKRVYSSVLENIIFIENNQ